MQKPSGLIAIHSDAAIVDKGKARPNLTSGLHALVRVRGFPDATAYPHNQPVTELSIPYYRI
jgi:hypothetical protein